MAYRWAVGAMASGIYLGGRSIGPSVGVSGLSDCHGIVVTIS